MKLLAALLLAFVVQPAGNVDDQAAWLTCVKPSCNPGGVGTPTFVDEFPVTNVTRDGHARRFDVSGPADTNALWYIYAGETQASAHNGLIDLWIYLPAADDKAQAFEYDAFQYEDSTRYMFGHQCDQLGSGRWDVWDALHGQWVVTGIPCELSKDVWHHLQIAFHREGTYQHYDSITIDDHVNAVNLVESAGPLPHGWANTSGLNIQLDIGPEGATISEYVDEANLLLFGF